MSYLIEVLDQLERRIGPPFVAAELNQAQAAGSQLARWQVEMSPDLRQNLREDPGARLCCEWVIMSPGGARNPVVISSYVRVYKLTDYSEVTDTKTHPGLGTLDVNPIRRPTWST